MAGGFDLYGNYYSSSRDAFNAETAQCAEIDAGIAARHIQELQEKQQSEEYYTAMRIQSLEQKIAELEQKLADLLANKNNG